MKTKRKTGPIDEEFVERLASSLPEREPSDDLWNRVSRSLASGEIRTAPAEKPRRWWRWDVSSWLVLRPQLRYAIYLVAIIVGTTASLVLLTRQTRDLPPAEAVEGGDQEMLFDAQEDIDQAIRYYESAIAKLTILAEKNIPNLSPEFVTLQKERIADLRKSIDECKTALNKNKLHPEVQFYLLTAYNDLQGTLQEMITTKN